MSVTPLELQLVLTETRAGICKAIDADHTEKQIHIGLAMDADNAEKHESTRAQRTLSFRACVWALLRRPPKLVILARLSNISENDLRKTQYISAGIVINPTLLTTCFDEWLTTHYF